MTETLSAPVLVLVDIEGQGEHADAAVATDARLTGPSLELLNAARTLTSDDVIALVLGTPGATTSSQLAGAGATRLLVADLDGHETQAAAAADALVSAARATGAAAAFVTSDYRGKELAGRAAVLLDSAATSDAAELEVVDGELRAGKLVLSGSWSTTISVTPDAGRAPVVAVRPGAFEARVEEGAAPLAVEPLDVVLSPDALAVRLVSREATAAASGPVLTEARTVVVGGRGVDGDFDLVHSLADPLGAAVGATRVACDEGWIERSAQVGQTGSSIAPRLYIGLGVSGAVHHTSGIQGAGTIVAVCDDSEAPIFEMADFGVVGDVTEVVPQLVEELESLRG